MQANGTRRGPVTTTSVSTRCRIPAFEAAKAPPPKTRWSTVEPEHEHKVSKIFIYLDHNNSQTNSLK